MDLRFLSISIISLVAGIYYIVKGIKMYRTNVVISYSSEREKTALAASIFWLIQMTFTIDNYRVYLTGLLIGIIPIMLLAIYIAYSRINSIKYEICNINKKIYEEVILNTLIEENIEFMSKEDFIELKETSIYIEFINNGILIKRIKQLPNYKQLLIKLEVNIKNIKQKKKKRGWLYSTLGGVVLVSMAIVSMAIAINFITLR